MTAIKNIFRTCIYGFMIILVGICIYTFVATDIMKKDYVNVFGYTYFVVASGSMSGTIEVNDIVFVKIDDDVDVDDIITYKDREGTIITHRLIEKKGNKLIAKGDANNTIDDPITKENLIGEVCMIVSPSFILKLIATFIIIFILLAIINFDNIIKKYIIKENNDTKNTVPEDIFSSKKSGEDSSSDFTIPIEEIEKIKEIQEKEVEEDEMIEVLEIIDIDSNDIVKKETSSAKEKEKELLELVFNLLKVKNNTLTTTKINKKWISKYQYIYKLTKIILIDDMNQLMDDIQHPPFKEIYDYDLEKIGLYENLRNKIYDMPIYVFLRILTFAILYNDEKFFDGIYKIMKYKIMIDQNDCFKRIKKSDTHGKKQLRLLMSFMKKISSDFDNKKMFELEKIESAVEMKKKSK